MPHQNIKYMYMFTEGMCLMLGELGLVINECVFKFNMLVRAGFYIGLCIIVCIFVLLLPMFLFLWKVGDMAERGICEAFKVKQAVLLSSTEAAEMILRVDEIITCAPRRREDRM